ncbi:MAG: hypothetical protein AAF696_10475, partial [Bacteroidota bacterium]
MQSPNELRKLISRHLIYVFFLLYFPSQLIGQNSVILTSSPQDNYIFIPDVDLGNIRYSQAEFSLANQGSLNEHIEIILEGGSSPDTSRFTLNPGQSN